jgi:hypothetical protein
MKKEKAMIDVIITILVITLAATLSSIYEGIVYSQPVTMSIPSSILKPVAEPGWDQVAKSSELFELDGGRSADPNGLKLAYAWTQVMGPDVMLDDPSAETPKFVVPKTGEKINLTFQLIVSNEAGIPSDPDYVTVHVDPDLPQTLISSPATS